MKIVFTIDRHKWTGRYQLSITNKDGVGYRIAGPKYDGNSHTLLAHELTQGDAQEIRRYLDAAFPLQP